MRAFIKPLLCSSLLLMPTYNSHAETHQAIDQAQLKTEAKEVIQSLAKHLGGELKKAAKSGGLPAAIEVCNTQAAPITAQVAKDSGWQVARTSLKLRNPSNTPDAWEKVVLEKFSQQASKGANLKTLAYSEVLTDNHGNKTFRMMKAIPVGEKCLACHGSQLKPGISQKLSQLYPSDNAQGFKAGDLRGAFTLQKAL